MRKLLFKLKRWVAVLVAQRFLVKQGYTRKQAKQIAKGIVSVSDIETRNIFTYFKSASKKQ